jgi:hypothetical protein
MMENGGNERASQFFKQHGLDSSDATVKIDGKYSSRAAELYREKLRAEVGGVEAPPKKRHEHSASFGSGFLMMVLMQCLSRGPVQGHRCRCRCEHYASAHSCRIVVFWL